MENLNPGKKLLSAEVLNDGSMAIQEVHRDFQCGSLFKAAEENVTTANLAKVSKL